MNASHGPNPDRPILFIDNHDSFSWNLVALLRSFTPSIVVVEPEDPVLDRLLPESYGAFVISPGPGRPEHIPAVLRLIQRTPRTPILGICLGMQCLGVSMGLHLHRLPYPRHGHTAEITHEGHSIFAGIPTPLRATRYHSLGFFVDDVAADAPLEVVASTRDDERTIVMALRHRVRPFIGVQFHPESFLSTHGAKLVANFLQGST